MRTPAFETFVAPAKPTMEIWRLLGGLVIVFAVWFLWILLVLGAVVLTSGTDALNGWMARMALGLTPTSVLLMLSTLFGFALGCFVAVKLLHHRPIGTLFGPRQKMLSGFGVAMVLAIVVLGGSSLVWHPGYDPLPNTPMNIWASFLPLAVFAVLVQTGAEEVFFRGYLQQQLGARFRSPWMWMVLPSIAFGLLHWNAGVSTDTAIYIVCAATLFGLIAADLTNVTGSIGAAWGWHFVNNCFAILIVSLDGALSGLSLYTTPFEASNGEILKPLIVRDMAFSVILWAILRGLFTFWSKRRPLTAY